MLDRHEVKKVGMVYRLLSFFISLCCVMALLGIVAYGRDEGVSVGIILITLAPIALLYVFVPITIIGYPPRLLLWISGRK